MMFFQAILLLGYLYAHLSDRWLSIRNQMFLHTCVVIAAGLLLPIAVPEDWVVSDPGRPTVSLLKLLTIAVGGPFFALSANATLLQRWFSTTKHPAARDPYFLYAVSNAGSMIGLLAYPIWVEPRFGLTQQTHAWAIGFGLLVVGVIGCVIVALADGLSPVSNANANDANANDAKEHRVSDRVTWSQRSMWVLLAFLPSSWLLSVTTRLTTDIAPIPLLWVVPLAIYLLTFVLAFASRVWLPHRMVQQWTAAMAIMLVASTVAPLSMWMAGLNLLAFFFGAMLCHGELVRRRPNTNGLTEFYLWLSVGGVLGGFFNAIVVPNVFTVLLEFGIVVAIVCLFTTSSKTVDDDDGETVEPDTESIQHTSSKMKRKRRSRTIASDSPQSPAPQQSIFDSVTMKKHWPLGVAALLSVVMLRGISSDNANSSAWVTLAVVLLIPTLLVLHVTRRTIVFALLVGTALMVGEFDPGPQYDVVYRARSFFGRHLVVDDHKLVGMGQQPRYRRLLHGTTQHGFQSLDPSRQCEPLAYYHRTGPLGDIFRTYISPSPLSSSRGGMPASPKQVAAIGLGTGALACYASEDCQITFIEVDPTVRDIAQQSKYFTYLSQCGGDHCRVVIADGRQAMEAAKDDQYDLILLDAFSSDAVPIHLMTREAIAIYLAKLKSGGVLAFHISNKYLHLDRVLAAVAKDLNVSCRVKHDAFTSQRNRYESIRMGKADAWYFVLARDGATLQPLDESWQTPQVDPGVRVWTDDYSNLISVMQMPQ